MGAPGILPQSDTEAYLWAKRAAEAGLVKAMYAVGYFSEVGIGMERNLTEYVFNYHIRVISNLMLTLSVLRAISWYKRAAQLGDRRAAQRLEAAKAPPPSPKGPFISSMNG